VFVHVYSASNRVCWVADVNTARIVVCATNQCRHRVQRWSWTGEHGRDRPARNCISVILHHDYDLSLDNDIAFLRLSYKTVMQLLYNFEIFVFSSFSLYFVIFSSVR